MPSYKDLLKVHNGYYIWPKYASVKINEYFTTDEFACKCAHPDCNEQRVAIELVDKVTAVRRDVGCAVFITSAFRCRKHQVDLSNTPGVETVNKSQHELGRALDMKCKKMTEMYVSVLRHFKAVGKAKTFLHGDLRDDKERRWTYGY